MRTDFPQNNSEYLKAEDFQDIEKVLTFVGWDQKANEDDSTKDRKNPQTWKQKLKYQLRYSYPEYAVDEVGEQRVGKDGKPFKNRYWDPAFPHGYTIVYHFDEGQLETGSLPLFEGFCRLRPSKGEKIAIKRIGKDKETKWLIHRAGESDHLPEIQMDREPDPLDSMVESDRTPF